MPDIFVSYAREDETRVRLLVRLLEAGGWNVFWDRTIPPGETWHSWIGRNLDQASCVMVAWSEQSIGSDWVREEADEGKRRRVLIPLLLDEVTPPLGHRSVQAADLIGWVGDSESPKVDTLVGWVKAKIGDPAIAKSTPRADAPLEAAINSGSATDPLKFPSPDIRDGPPNNLQEHPRSPKPAGDADVTPERGRVADSARPHDRSNWKLQRLWLLGIGGLLLALLLLGVDGWLTTQQRTWNTLRIWGLAKMGLYQGPEMIAIRPGEGKFPATFEMGSTEGGEDEQPVRTVEFAKPFAIGRYEITFDEYGAYTLDEGLAQPDDRDWGLGDRPVLDVSWDDSEDYIAWLNTVTKKGPKERFRLPSEAEWEYATRASTTTIYWWGDEIQQDGGVWANCDGCSSKWDNEQTAPVGRLPANAFGMHDTAGNVYEWVEDCWHNNYENAPDDGSAWLETNDEDCDLRVIRGGSWYHYPGYLRSANRDNRSGDSGNVTVGFRLAQDLPD